MTTPTSFFTPSHSSTHPRRTRRPPASIRMTGALVGQMAPPNPDGSFATAISETLHTRTKLAKKLSPPYVCWGLPLSRTPTVKLTLLRGVAVPLKTPVVSASPRYKSGWSTQLPIRSPAAHETLSASPPPFACAIDCVRNESNAKHQFPWQTTNRSL